jgi:hypothetical protein
MSLSVAYHCRDPSDHLEQLIVSKRGATSTTYVAQHVVDGVSNLLSHCGKLNNSGKITASSTHHIVIKEENLKLILSVRDVRIFCKVVCLSIFIVCAIFRPFCGVKVFLRLLLLCLLRCGLLRWLG